MTWPKNICTRSAVTRGKTCRFSSTWMICEKFLSEMEFLSRVAAKGRNVPFDLDASSDMIFGSFNLAVCVHRFMAEEFHRFLMAFSLRPGSSLAISHHRFPNAAWALYRIRHSLSSQSHFLIEGSKWLNHRSRHCLPMRPGKEEAMTLHLMLPAPRSSTISLTRRSSSCVHGPLLRPGRSTLFQRWRHWTSERTSPRMDASRFQFLAPWASTISRRRRSSSSVHFPPTGALRGGRNLMSTAPAPPPSESPSSSPSPTLPADMESPADRFE
mmetsp:Transcript_16395/g.58226  ORF Transcript_16395/g.58226 Transcript_16395/m.58226 type:complete len:270 (-) Transcript_16395:303-1112(-)